MTEMADLDRVTKYLLVSVDDDLAAELAEDIVRLVHRESGRDAGVIILDQRPEPASVSTEKESDREGRVTEMADLDKVAASMALINQHKMDEKLREEVRGAVLPVAEYLRMDANGVEVCVGIAYAVIKDYLVGGY